MRKKILLILGASSDVGCAYVEKHCNDYDTIIAQYHCSKDKLTQIKDNIGDKLILYKIDCNNLEEIESFIKYMKQEDNLPTHVLHLTAPKVSNNRFSKLNWDSYDKDINIQIRFLVEILRVCLPSMSKSGGGKILVMLSSYTFNQPPKYMASYVTVKYALLGLVKALASEYVGKNICINGISPSMMETKFLDNVPELMVQQAALNHPLKRNIKVSEIIPTMHFLLSKDSDLITGQNICISGGETI